MNWCWYWWVEMNRMNWCDSKFKTELKDNCTTLSQLNSIQQWNNVCWLLIRNINTLSLSYDIDVIGCIWTVRMWELTHTLTHTEYMHEHVEICWESQSNVESWYNLIEIERIAIEMLSWQNDTVSTLLSIRVFELRSLHKREIYQFLKISVIRDILQILIFLLLLRMFSTSDWIARYCDVWSTCE
jgi:hypothetical protein